MNTPYRQPQIEEGVHNLLWQNRAGNRLTMMLFADRTELEVSYKPHAARRKDFRARNFSNRDNFTSVFCRFTLPEVTSASVKEFRYDPFVAQLELASPTGARNLLHVFNLPDENAFALSARAPLLLALRPHEAFHVRDGLLLEPFSDRGESIVSFLHFPGFEQNRYRVLEDGIHIVQLIENDLVLFGAEDNPFQAERTVRRFTGFSIGDLTSHIENGIRVPLSRGRVRVATGDLQRVLDVNRRVVWSMFDEGGVTFGALTRVYHLIWLRDTSMSASALARAGWPDALRLATPFILDNPTVKKTEEGKAVSEFSQLIGSRWSKSEDDGIFYALLSLFTLVQTTGDIRLLEGALLEQLFHLIDHAVTSRFDEELGFFASDTLGEDALASNPYYGYDVVNGQLVESLHRADRKGPAVVRAASLYQNVNMYNVLRMAQVLQAQSGNAQLLSSANLYDEYANRLAFKLQEHFVNGKGRYRSVLLLYEDGSRRWLDFELGCDYWEHSWAVSAGPFLPEVSTSIASAREVIDLWPDLRNYGYCPWNYLLRHLHEHGLPPTRVGELLAEQIRDALATTSLFPMAGLVTEYQKEPEGWRGLPFGIGSLCLAIASDLLHALPLGLAVRAGGLATHLDNFHYRNARLDVITEGSGDFIHQVFFDNVALLGSLQIPENLISIGCHQLRVVRGDQPFPGPRLYASTAQLNSVDHDTHRVTLSMWCPFASTVTLENAGALKELNAKTSDGRSLDLGKVRMIEGTNLSIIQVPGSGAFELRLEY